MARGESLAPVGERVRPLPDQGPGRAELLLRALVVALGAGILCVALLLEPGAPGSGRLRIGGIFLPETCALKATTGVPCPGCGLTRSWVSALHGDPAGSLAHHPLGWLVLLYALAQGARHGAWLAAPQRRASVERLGGRLDRGVLVLGALLLGAWIPRLFETLSR